MTKSNSFLVHVAIIMFVDELGVYVDEHYMNDTLTKLAKDFDLDIPQSEIESTSKTIIKYIDTYPAKQARLYIIEDLKELFFASDLK